MCQERTRFSRSLLVLFKEPLLKVESATMLAPAPATSPSPTAHLSTIFSPGDLVVSVHTAQGLAVQRDETADSRDGGSGGSPLSRREP